MQPKCTKQRQFDEHVKILQEVARIKGSGGIVHDCSQVWSAGIQLDSSAHKTRRLGQPRWNSPSPHR